MDQRKYVLVVLSPYKPKRPDYDSYFVDPRFFDHYGATVPYEPAFPSVN